MILEFVSSPKALVINGKAMHVVNPWHLIIDTEMESITVWKRNQNLISLYEQVISFKFIRSIQINRHLVGADVHISLFNGIISAYCLSSEDAQTIKRVLLECNRNAEINPLMLV